MHIHGYPYPEDTFYLFLGRTITNKQNLPGTEFAQPCKGGAHFSTCIRL